MVAARTKEQNKYLLLIVYMCSSLLVVTLTVNSRSDPDFAFVKQTLHSTALPKLVVGRKRETETERETEKETEKERERERERKERKREWEMEGGRERKSGRNSWSI